MASQLVKQFAIYSAYVVLRETLDCFLISHEIGVDPKLKHRPEELFLSKTLPTQYESI